MNKKMTAEEALKELGPSPTKWKMTRVLNKMSVKERRRLKGSIRSTLRNSKKLLRTYELSGPAAYSEMSGRTESVRKSGIQSESLLDIGQGVNLNDRTRLLPSLHKHGGKHYLDLRVWFLGPDHQLHPTRKGVRVPMDRAIELFKQVASLIRYWRRYRGSIEDPNQAGQ